MADRRDGNENTIVEVWRRLGAVWIKQARTAGFDGVLVYDGKAYIVEIKNPEYAWELTAAESKRLLEVEGEHVAYNIVETIEDALKMIGR